MKKSLFIFVVLASSCSSKDPKMCECLEAGEKLNKFSAEIMLREITRKDAEKMTDLKREKAQKCANYQQMSGEEMLKRKSQCEQN